MKHFEVRRKYRLPARNKFSGGITLGATKCLSLTSLEAIVSKLKQFVSGEAASQAMDTEVPDVKF